MNKRKRDGDPGWGRAVAGLILAFAIMVAAGAAMYLWLGGGDEAGFGAEGADYRVEGQGDDILPGVEHGGGGARGDKGARAGVFGKYESHWLFDDGEFTSSYEVRRNFAPLEREVETLRLDVERMRKDIVEIREAIGILLMDEGDENGAR